MAALSVLQSTVARCRSLWMLGPPWHGATATIIRATGGVDVAVEYSTRPTPTPTGKAITSRRGAATNVAFLRDGSSSNVGEVCNVHPACFGARHDERRPSSASTSFDVRRAHHLLNKYQCNGEDLLNQAVKPRIPQYQPRDATSNERLQLRSDGDERRVCLGRLAMHVEPAITSLWSLYPGVNGLPSVQAQADHRQHRGASTTEPTSGGSGAEGCCSQAKAIRRLERKLAQM